MLVMSKRLNNNFLSLGPEFHVPERESTASEQALCQLTDESLWTYSFVCCSGLNIKAVNVKVICV